MPKTLQATEIDLAKLEELFAIAQSSDAEFFDEWRGDLPKLTENEQLSLDDLKTDYLHLSKHSLLEPLVKMVVLAPILKLAGFYRDPFYLKAEQVVNILSQDQDILIQGRIDILVFKPPFWIVVIEAKRAAYSVEVGIPQALTYMMANPHPDRPVFGLVTNGSEFIFLKLQHQDSLKYAESDLFSIKRSNDLYTVVSILKHLAQLAI
ncbi:type I restriction enzyme HsdR N-terminal domain-containing protein [Pseudanabaena sp. ABRG5-3]|uniref:type I restriction enzyme HsdR N-terminal domain-containing protein n=1 Tax=Pseudanabaena sp. ABRG5-3 TaxID=685565 RepID=UPI000DC70D3C|nr:type I restriction enzyme HsdR N-terminal domain-containing protein [Pseudanabaena sp. ABRG5-3]BBC25717.1 type I restriction enzyme R protein N terminal domain protein [Pseudanabaena sp. ABRG5-3]